MNYIHVDRDRRLIACYPARSNEASADAHAEYIDVCMQEITGPVTAVIACESVGATAVYCIRHLVSVARKVKERLQRDKLRTITLASPSMVARWMATAITVVVPLPPGCDLVVVPLDKTK